MGLRLKCNKPQGISLIRFSGVLIIWFGAFPTSYFLCSDVPFEVARFFVATLFCLAKKRKWNKITQVRGFIFFQEKNILISRCVKMKPVLPVNHLVRLRNLAHIPYKVHLFAHTFSEAVQARHLAWGWFSSFMKIGGWMKRTTARMDAADIRDNRCPWLNTDDTTHRG